MNPKKLGRYDLIRVLGKGAMGLVYEGRDPNLDRRVAIKTIRVENLSQEAAAEYEVRFRTEARSAARLQHPNIVSVYDSDRDGDIAFLVMEFIQGDDLKHHLDMGDRHTLEQTLAVMGDLLAALDYAHRQNIVHRDIKPANLLIEASGRVKLTDFGVARIQDSGDATRTQGSMVGTLKYMSPEQVQGQPVDARADLFAAGIVLYQLLTGKRPFDGDSDFAIIQQIVAHRPQAPSSVNAQLPPAIDAVVARALSKSRDQRFATGGEFAAALKAAAAQAADPAAVAPPTQTGPGRNTTWTGTLRAGESLIDSSVGGSTVSQELELVYWKDVKDSTDIEDLLGYLARFPNGIYTDLARRRLRRLGVSIEGDSGLGSRSGTAIPLVPARAAQSGKPPFQPNDSAPEARPSATKGIDSQWDELSSEGATEIAPPRTGAGTGAPAASLSSGTPTMLQSRPARRSTPAAAPPAPSQAVADAATTRPADDAAASIGSEWPVVPSTAVEAAPAPMSASPASPGPAVAPAAPVSTDAPPWSIAPTASGKAAASLDAAPLPEPSPAPPDHATSALAATPGNAVPEPPSPAWQGPSVGSLAPNTDSDANANANAEKGTGTGAGTDTGTGTAASGPTAAAGKNRTLLVLAGFAVLAAAAWMFRPTSVSDAPVPVNGAPSAGLPAFAGSAPAAAPNGGGDQSAASVASASAPNTTTSASTMTATTTGSGATAGAPVAMASQAAARAKTALAPATAASKAGVVAKKPATEAEAAARPAPVRTTENTAAPSTVPAAPNRSTPPTLPARSPTQASTTARLACEDKKLFAFQSCMNEQCASAAFARDPECVGRHAIEQRRREAQSNR